MFNFFSNSDNKDLIKDKVRGLEWDLKDAERSLKDVENDYWDCKLYMNGKNEYDMPNIYTNLIYYKDKVESIKDKIRDLERQL